MICHRPGRYFFRIVPPAAFDLVPFRTEPADIDVALAVGLRRPQKGRIQPVSFGEVELRRHHDDILRNARCSQLVQIPITAVSLAGRGN